MDTERLEQEILLVVDPTSRGSRAYSGAVAAFVGAAVAMLSDSFSHV